VTALSVILDVNGSLDVRVGDGLPARTARIPDLAEVGRRVDVAGEDSLLRHRLGVDGFLGVEAILEPRSVEGRVAHHFGGRGERAAGLQERCLVVEVRQEEGLSDLHRGFDDCDLLAVDLHRVRDGVLVAGGVVVALERDDLVPIEQVRSA
jgi:hypothetical protein